MKAMVLTAFGGPEGLELQELDTPTPGRGEVLVEVHATSVNPADLGVRSGMFGSMVSLPLVQGYDVSGVVRAVADDVTRVAVGDEVVYAVALTQPRGGNAAYHVARADSLSKKLRTLSHAEAAAVPVAGGTAYEALISGADVRLGQTVLIHGAAGGVGSFAVQLAKATGAYVFASCGDYDAALVSHLGADRVIDYRREDANEVVLQDTAGEGVDVVLDAAGGKMAVAGIAATRVGGQIVTVTGAQGDLNAAMRKNLTVRFIHLEDTRDKLDKLRPLIERGQVKPVIGARYPLEQLAEAHARLEAGGKGVHGKVVIDVV